MRRFGWQVFYGDATRLDLLRIAGADKARVLVLAIDDVEQSLQVAQLAREHFPQLTIVAARATSRTTTGCANWACTLIERETLDSALMSARSVLELMGWQPHAARTQALRFRRHSIELLEQMAPHHGRREEADRAGQAGPPAARGAVGARTRGTAPGIRAPQRGLVGIGRRRRRR